MKSFLEPLEKRKRQRAKLAEKLESLARTRHDLEYALSNYRNFDSQLCATEISKLHLERSQVSESIFQVEKALQSESAKLRELDSEAVNMFHIVKYFSDNQKILRSKIREHGDRVKNYQEHISRLQKRIDHATLEIEKMEAEIVTFQNFDKNSVETQLDQAEGEWALTSDALAALDNEIADITAKVGPLINKYDDLQVKAHTLKARVSDAEGIDRDLTNAENSYERAQIHKKCERKFGHGSPKKVRSDASRELRSVERNLPKLERRIRDEMRKFEMVISHVIIDGNNTCYNNSQFIRLRALTHLVDELNKNYRVTAVFDSSIRSLMKTDDAGIRRIIGPSAGIHIAPTRTGADEYILRLAEGQPDCYVLSNDRFAEFGDYEVVQSGRLLRFLIADHQIMVNDLDLAITFRS